MSTYPFLSLFISLAKILTCDHYNTYNFKNPSTKKNTKKNTLLVQSLSFSWLSYISSDKLNLMFSATCSTRPFTSLFLLPLSPTRLSRRILQLSSPLRPLWPPLPPPFLSLPNNCQPLYILGVSQDLWFRNGSQQVHKSSSTLLCSHHPPPPLSLHTHLPACFRSALMQPSLDLPQDFEDFPPSLILPRFSLHINEPLRIPSDRGEVQ